MVVMVKFTYEALSNARDVNLMSSEHATLLHNVVAELNMPLSLQAPIEQHLQQERFLLQVATLIERQPLPETVATFSVTPQLFAGVLTILGALTATTLWNLGSGIVDLRT